MLHFQGSCLQTLTIPLATTLSEHVIQLWKEQAWPLHSSVFPNQGQAAADPIQLGMADGIFDGSYMSVASPDFATTAWLLEDSHFPHQNLCCGFTHDSGPPAEANTYCAELQGLHMLLLAIKGLCSFHVVTSGSVIVGCNNLRASVKLNRSRSSPHVALPMPIPSGPSTKSLALSWESPFTSSM